jgi:hypothetical protein
VDAIRKPSESLPLLLNGNLESKEENQFARKWYYLSTLSWGNPILFLL